MKNILINQSNLLTLSRSELNVLEQKVLFRLIEILIPIIGEQSNVLTSDEYTYLGDLSDSTAVLRLQTSTIDIGSINHSQLSKALKSLLYRTIELKRGNIEVVTSFLLYYTYEQGSDQLHLGIHNELYRFLFDMSKGHSLVELKTILTLSSIHAITIYELLCKERASKKFYISMDELRTLTNTTNKYSKIGRFREQVLDIAKRLLDANQITDLRFSYTQEKVGRAVVGFHIRLIHTSVTAEIKNVVDRSTKVVDHWSTNPDINLFSVKVGIDTKNEYTELINKLATRHPDPKELLQKLEEFERAAQKAEAYSVSGYILGCVRRYTA